MDARIRTLLSWQLRFQSRRMSTWVFGGIYVLGTLALISMSPNIRMLPPGQIPFRILQTVHALTAAAFAIQLAGQSMDDKLSGTLGFLKIANLSPISWVTFRFAALIIAYLPIWTLRVPIYVLVLSLGGVRLEDVLWLEAVQWVVFLTISSVALLVARYSATQSALAVATLMVVVFWQGVLHLPLIVLALLSVMEQRPFGAMNHPWASALSQLSPLKYFWTHPTVGLDWGLAVGGFGLHLALALLLLRILARVVYFNAGTEMSTEEPVQARAERKSTTRTSRRVVGDPLAWLTCHVHAGTPLQVRTSMTVFGCVAALAVAFVLIREPIPRTITIAVTCGMTLMILAFKPSDCLARELKAKTLSTLALLPMDGREIYEGWERGARRLARPTYLAVAAGGVLLTFLARDAAPYIWMVFVFAVLLLPEAAFLSNLLARKGSFLDLDVVQIVINLWVIFLIGVLLAISLPIAIFINAWAGLTTFVGVTLIARSMLLADFARFMADRVEREQ